jgi:hypothetical protein
VRGGQAEQIFELQRPAFWPVVDRLAGASRARDEGRVVSMPFDGSVARSDLNYLLFRKQIERSRACTSSSADARSVHGDLADLYQQRIERLTRGNIRFPSC